MRCSSNNCRTAAAVSSIDRRVTSDDASRYRDQGEFDEARKLEPLIRFKAFLQSKHQWSDLEDKALYADCDTQVKNAIKAYQATPDQAPGGFFDYMFEKPTVDLVKQKHDWLAEVKRHG